MVALNVVGSIPPPTCYDQWGAVVSMAAGVCDLGMTDAHKPVIEMYVITGLCPVYLYCDVGACILGRCVAAREAVWAVTRFCASAIPSSTPE